MLAREVSGLQDDLSGTNYLSDMELPAGLCNDVLTPKPLSADGSKDSTLSQFGKLTLCDSAVTTNNAQVERNLSGKVSRVVYPNGDSKSFEYGPDGLLNRIEYKDGSCFTKEGSSWVLYDHYGQKQDVTLGKDKIDVDSDGNFIFLFNDGDRNISTPSGAVLTKDKNGSITQIAYPKGEIKEFKYVDGKLVEYRSKDGLFSWKLDGDTWNLYDEHGARTGDTMGKDRVWLEKDGTFVFYEAATGQLTKTRTDGCIVKE